MVNEAERMRARSLMSRFVWATIALGLFAGIAGGAALGAWAIARRTSTVYDRFVTYEDASTLSVGACDEDVDPGAAGEQCRAFDYADIRDFLESVPGFASAGRVTAALVGIAPVGEPDAHELTLLQFPVDMGAVPGMGKPLVVAGRLADPTVASEVVINEQAAHHAGLEVGDQFVITPYRVEEFDIANEGVEPPGGVPITMTVTGIVRRPGDLVGRMAGKDDDDMISIVPGPAWWEAVGGDVATYGSSLLIATEPGTTDESMITAITDRWPDRPFQFVRGSLSGSEDQHTVVDAIHLQAIGLELVSIALALAGVVFAGQALARQARREWDDSGVLDALGMTRSDMVAAAAIRSLATIAVAVVTATVVAAAISPLGPIGIGRAAEPEPGVVIDPFVLAVGLPLLALTVFVGAVIPVATMRRRAAPAHVGRAGVGRISGVLPPAGVTGLAMTTSRRAGGVALGSAIAGVALAAAAGVAAWSLVASYDDLVARPERYGATWDAMVGNVGGENQQDETRAKLDEIDGIRAVGLKSSTGLYVSDTATIVAGEPYLGDVAFARITDGRAPLADDEVALGRGTLDQLGVGIGDTATLTDVVDPGNSREFEVVGEVVLNDGLSAQPGQGALVTVAAFDEMAPENLSQSYAVWIDQDVDREATLDALRAAFPSTFDADPRPPSSVRNLGLIADQPALIALVVGVLAGAALVHALVSSVRRGRRQIGVLKSLGFTRWQVSASVAWHASTLAGAALVVGIPLGIVTGRVTWSFIADDLGVVSGPVLPVGAVAVITALVLIVANLAALGPGLSAARTRAATALRTE